MDNCPNKCAFSLGAKKKQEKKTRKSKQETDRESMENCPNKFTFSLGSKTLKNRQQKQETDGEPMKTCPNKCTFSLGAKKFKNKTRKSKQETNGEPTKTCPNKFTFSLVQTMTSNEAIVFVLMPLFFLEPLICFIAFDLFGCVFCWCLLQRALKN